jgi:hypothetical protein
MAHYAWLNNDNKVVAVTVGKDETELINGLDTETYYSQATGHVIKRTSYNRKIRFNYAGIGYTYDEVRDGFIPPKCHDEAVVNDKCLWDCTNADHDTLAI